MPWCVWGVGAGEQGAGRFKGRSYPCCRMLYLAVQDTKDMTYMYV